LEAALFNISLDDNVAPNIAGEISNNPTNANIYLENLFITLLITHETAS
jgi:hypothetical protein